ncbi:hypothetical protein BXU10_22355 [Flavobacterium sp. LM4]|nr:hypothetical protein BXU10_22355 [Flavobacterium sp. LM4]
MLKSFYRLTHFYGFGFSLSEVSGLRFKTRSIRTAYFAACSNSDSVWNLVFLKLVFHFTNVLNSFLCNF